MRFPYLNRPSSENLEQKEPRYQVSAVGAEKTADSDHAADMATGSSTEGDSSPPVALLIFNRPEPTGKVLASMAQARPSKVLVVADGPRAHVPEDADKCAEARALIELIDWDCEVLTNYSPVNMGCKARVSSGLQWVFENVEEAVILEDDCIPHPTFFRFCKELLARYRDDERVMMISGDNFQMGRNRTPYSYYFSRFCHCWGWATWRRAWKHYDIDMELWPVLRDGRWLFHLMENNAQARTYRKQFDAVAGGADTWDYQWAFACMVRNGLSIVPSRNLITNAGFSQDRTSLRYHPFGRLPCEEMEFPLKHPPFMVRHADADAAEHCIEYGRFRRAEWMWRFRQSVAYYGNHPSELARASYRGMRNLLPLRWRREIRDGLGLAHGISLLKALRQRSKGSRRSPLSQKPPDLKFANVIGPYDLTTGLGESCRSIVRACEAAGIGTVVYGLGSPDRLTSCRADPTDRSGTDFRDVIFNILHFGADFVPAARKTFGSTFFSRRYNIGYWVWETERFPRPWRPYIESFDEVWTPSTFCADIFSRELNVPVVRMPHNVAPKPPAWIDRRELGLPESGFIFLVMTDFASMSERKNPVGALKAFFKAFGSKNYGVYLCLKTIGAHSWKHDMPPIQRFLSTSDSIVHIDGAFDRSRIDALINACDCLVSLHRSEGFGLPIAEAMYLGKPVIATGYSGNMDFMNTENSFPVRFELIELDEDVGPFEKGSHWAEPDTEHAAEIMKRVAGDPDLCARIGFRAATRIKSDFSPANTGSLVRSRLERIVESNADFLNRKRRNSSLPY
ncbi:MAG: glycosyltransferase family 4 protein [Desulfomonilaceae bacterium]|nr:glycosyltransferase family 4 protein [Desulfomonilaceae bacterium]